MKSSLSLMAVTATNMSGQNYGTEIIDFANIYKLETTRITIKLFDQLVIEGLKFCRRLYLTAILLDFALNVLLSSLSALSVLSGAGIIVENK